MTTVHKLELELGTLFLSKLNVVGKERGFNFSENLSGDFGRLAMSYFNKISVIDTPEVLEKLRVRLNTVNGVFTPKSVEVGRSFKPREDDIFVATAPKSGTTWT
eukprot:snap_masked-scaffold_60-processed-gene-0.0-mRNA-1 protein AED:1.00 eAED:1.00 QI:0/0/0/0/1/1/2/0/103